MLYSPAPPDTLAHWLKGKPLGAFIDRSQSTVYDACRALDNTGWFGSSRPKTDHEAVNFYLMNHAASRIAQKRDLLEPLPDNELAMLRHYVEHGSNIAARLFWYTLLITTREARHNKSSSSKAGLIAKQVQQTYPDTDTDLLKKMFEFTKSCADTDTILHDHMLVAKTQQFPLGPYAKTLSAIFHNCSWNGGYGGPAWGAIADALHSFVSGGWSAEMFADTAFTLAHNGGPMFNKDMLYQCYSGEFTQILDVQRAGMIPQWLETKKAANYNASAAYMAAKEAVPEIFEGEFSWKRVQEMGSVGDYSYMEPVVQKVSPPPGCKDKQIDVDYATSVWVLMKRAA